MTEHQNAVLTAKKQYVLMSPMRTTVTLDADVESMLKDMARRTRKSFKQTLNQAIRQGLAGSMQPAAKPFKIQSRPMGLKNGIDPTGLNRLADDLEAEAFLDPSRSDSPCDS